MGNIIMRKKIQSGNQAPNIYVLVVVHDHEKEAAQEFLKIFDDEFKNSARVRLLLAFVRKKGQSADTFDEIIEVAENFSDEKYLFWSSEKGI